MGVGGRALCHGLLQQSQAEVASAALDLVLGLQVVHALRGNAVNGQNRVSNSNATFGCLTAIRQLQRHKKYINK